MKIFLTLFALLVISGATAFAQNNPKYDKALADSLGADEYGMKSYVLAILKNGTNTSEDKDFLNNIFRGHMENIGRLADEGKLIVAGPLGKNDKGYRGIFVFNVKTIEEAQELVKTDPAIQEKVFDVELYPWYGSAALGLYLDVHEKIAKTNP